MASRRAIRIFRRNVARAADHWGPLKPVCWGCNRGWELVGDQHKVPAALHWQVGREWEPHRETGKETAG